MSNTPIRVGGLFNLLESSVKPLLLLDMSDFRSEGELPENEGTPLLLFCSSMYLKVYVILSLLNKR